MWFNRKSARRKRTGIGMRDPPAFQIKSRTEPAIDANGLKRAGGGVADPET